MVLPNSPFARPLSSFRTPLTAPTVDSDLDALVCVQFGVSYLPFVLGALKQLLLNTDWTDAQGSPAFNLTQQRIGDLIWEFTNAGPCSTMFEVRQNSTNPCVLEFSTDGGVTWTPFANLQLCPPAILPAPENPPAFPQQGIQPGGGSPAPGQCFDLDVTIQGNQQYLLPWNVTDDWSIEVTLVQGAWWDGSIIRNWTFYDGRIFFLGQDGGSGIPSETGDPITSAKHGALVIVPPVPANGAALVSGTPYNVPTGTGTGNYILQMNDSALGDNQGSITFHLQACNSEVIYITYPARGSGPSFCRVGDTITFTTALSTTWYVRAHFSHCVKLTVISATGWTLYSPGDGTPVGQYCDGSDITTQGALGAPTNWDASWCALETAADSATPFTYVVHIDALC